MEILLVVQEASQRQVMESMKKLSRIQSLDEKDYPMRQINCH